MTAHTNAPTLVTEAAISIISGNGRRFFRPDSVEALNRLDRTTRQKCSGCFSAKSCDRKYMRGLAAAAQIVCHYVK